MRRSGDIGLVGVILFAALPSGLAACGSNAAADAAATADLAPAPDLADLSPLLVGAWRQPAPGDAVATFTADGRMDVRIGGATYATALWTLTGQVLTLISDGGVCTLPAEWRMALYRIDVTAATLTFSLLSDPCPQRLVLLPATWTRLPVDGGI